MLVDSMLVEGRKQAVVATGALLTFEAAGARCRWGGSAGGGRSATFVGDALSQLWRGLVGLRVTGDHVPVPLRSMFGFVSYEAARGFERLPARHRAKAPDYLFFFPRICLATDGRTARVVGYGADAREAERSLRVGMSVLARADEASSTPEGGDRAAPAVAAVRSSFDLPGYVEAVRRAKRHLLDGDIFQVVLAVQQHLSTRPDPLWLYRRLAATSPGPFQFCYTGPRFSQVGVSPEPFVTATGRVARLRPLAGTRPRGRDAAHDQRLEVELRTSEKELAEHRMLVDLARNDLGRVCAAGTVHVDELLSVERYTHVMHLVSNVVGELMDPGAGEDLLRAAFPAGTMTGAPKVRAMEIIDALEPESRGLYSGLVGAIAAEEINTYLTIRSAHLTDDTVTVGAGAGIVHDSDPEAEYAECLVKLRTVTSILGAGEGRQ